jgi:hypothetical protein
LTPHGYSPAVLGKILRASAREPSFQEAAEALQDLADLRISSRHVTRIAEEVGRSLEIHRDQQVQQVEARQLPATVETRPALAVVEVDGGRLQIRGEGDGPGAHQASWREDKLALLATAASQTFDADPQPDLPACFRDPMSVEELVRGMGGSGLLSDSAPRAQQSADQPETGARQQASSPRQQAPKLLVRTYVASTCDSDAFGPMVAAEAHSRNLMAAARRAFVGDGAGWIWKLQRQCFSDFQAIVDFLHVLSHVFAAAKAAATEPAERWSLFLAWAEACWQGRVAWVLEQLSALQTRWGPLSDEEAASLPEHDPRNVLAQTLGYLEHNQDRMDYPRYRRQGLPLTSSHVESTVKQFNRRVKGTEKFWGEEGAEAILQLRAAFLSEDDRLARHLRTCPHSPFRTYQTRKNRKAA